MSAKVLVVEDEPSLNELLVYNLEAEGYQVSAAETGEQVKARLSEQIPDLVVLDWMLPDISGLEICRQLRASDTTRHIPVIMLTAKGEEQDRIRGFSTGVDDYVVKPFSLPELMARIRALLRRVAPERIADKLTILDIELDRTAHRVTRNKRKVKLGPTEFRLLEYFMEHADRVLTRTQLLDGVWGHDVYVDDRTVDVHIGRLRKALIRGTEADPVTTVRGVGYAMWKTPQAADEKD